MKPTEVIAQWLAGLTAPSEEKKCLTRADAIVNALAAVGYLITKSPVPVRLTCPKCGELHLDEGEFATKVHHTHACQSCGMVWRPAVVPTVGVRFLPGFKNEEIG